MNDIPLPKLQPGDSMGSAAINRLIARSNDNRLHQGDDSILVNQAGGAVFHQFIPGPNLPGLAFFQCLVLSDGSIGTYQGTTTALATYTYTVCDLEGNPIAYQLAPLNSPARIAYGPATIAPDYSLAMCYIDPMGAIGLWSCQETRVTAVCT